MVGLNFPLQLHLARAAEAHRRLDVFKASLALELMMRNGWHLRAPQA